MKKVFFVLISAAALSFTACTSGGNKTETLTDAQKDSLKQEAIDSANAAMMNQAPPDTSANMAMPDTTKKM